MDRELMAVVATLRHFRFLLEGRKFHVLTDHKPLVFALHRARQKACMVRPPRPPPGLRGRVHLGSAARGRSRPRELPLPRSTHLAGINSSRASTIAAVVPATQQVPIRWGKLARNQLTS